MISANPLKRKAPPSSNSRNNATRTSSGSNSVTNTQNCAITTNNSNNNASTNKNKASNPTTLQINNIPIHFPFPPYDVQTKYMKSVLDALGNGTHALLESPTGTGKTLCLLCSTLAWQQAQKGRADTNNLQQEQQSGGGVTSNNNDTISSQNGNGNNNKTPVIIYASRTHSQLSQVVNELKNTRYRPRHAVLGSREHMCIHPKVNPLASSSKSNNTTTTITTSSHDINHSCSKLTKEHKCLYRNNLESHGPDWHPSGPTHTQYAGDNTQPLRDMEDLLSIGKETKICPFYYTRGLISSAEIIFVPYNYLFDRDARETTLAEVDFTDSILIFDEAHNLEEFASESSSFDLSSGDVAGCVSEVQRGLQYLELNPDVLVGENGGQQSSSKVKDNMLRLKSIFLKLEQYLLEGVGEATKSAAAMGGESSSSHSGDFIFDIFRDGAGITYANQGILIAFVRQVQDLIMEVKGGGNSSATPKLDHFVNCLKRVFGTGTEMLAMARSKSYRVHITKVNGNNGGGFAGGRTLSYWCFAPSLAMRELAFLKVRSILITSGTLAPLPSFSMELGLEFPVQLENKHVIEPEQIFVRVIGKGVSGKQLSSKFGRRDDPEYILELGNTLASMCRNIPGGVLIFFPSYNSMQTCVERWGGPSNQKKPNDRGGKFFAARKKPQAPRYSFPQMPTHFMAQGEASTPWKRLLSRKPIVLEPRSTTDLNDAIAEFKKFIGLPKSPGCILMGVCRGKVSEGIDFSDDMCRAVIVTGLPFAPYLDPKVKLKRDFLDTARASEKTPSSTNGGFGDVKSTMREPEPRSSTTLSGAEWYNQQAHRAVNQAIGRVIRHRNDYGAVLFLDHRFSETRNRDGLSKWLRPYLVDESFGASTRSMVQFFKEAKAKSEKSRARPILKYEEPVKRDTALADNSVSQIAVVSASISREDNGVDNNAFIHESRIRKRIDLSEPPMKEASSVLPRNENAGINANKTATNLAQAYVKCKPTAKALSTDSTAPSVWDDLDTKPRATHNFRANSSKLKQSAVSSRRGKEDVKQQAKVFFDLAKEMLSKQDLLKTQQLLVAMKTHGDKKASTEYLSSAKSLLALLSRIDQPDRKRMKLISLLFPLLPMKFRYTLEKMGSKLCFENSTFSRLCVSKLPKSQLETIQKIIPQLMLNDDSIVDSHNRALLEDFQKVLSTLVKTDIDPVHFFALLPERHVRKAQAINIEVKKEVEMRNAKERSAQKKGEDFINPALFQKARPKAFVPTDPEQLEEADLQNLTSALSQGKAITDEKKHRVLALQNQRLNNAHPSTSVKSSTPSSSQNASTRAYDKNTDVVDKLLNQVKNDVYKPRLERLNGKVKANVPENFICSICNTPAKEPLVSNCNHSACMNCWKDWLSRQSTCPHCREHTEMKTLAKMVFTNDDEDKSEGFTQICQSESDGSEDELEFIT